MRSESRRGSGGITSPSKPKATYQRSRNRTPHTKSKCTDAKVAGNVAEQKSSGLIGLDGAGVVEAIGLAAHVVELSQMDDRVGRALAGGIETRQLCAPQITPEHKSSSRPVRQ